MFITYCCARVAVIAHSPISEVWVHTLASSRTANTIALARVAGGRANNRRARHTLTVGTTFIVLQKTADV